MLERIPPEALGQLTSILIIDNGSTDGTWEELSSFARERGDRRLRTFRNERNYTLGGSTIVALRTAISEGNRFLICLHSDGQADPADLPRFIASCRPDVDFVLGSRLMSGSQVDEYSRLRLAANRVFSWIQRKITGVSARDLGAYIAFNLHTIARLPYARVPSDMAYQPNLILLAFARGHRRVVEFPIRWGAADRSNVNLLAYGLRHLERLLRHALRVPPLTRARAEDFRSTEVAWR